MGSGGMSTTSARMLRSPVRQIFAPASIRDQSADFICMFEWLSLQIPNTRVITTTRITLADSSVLLCVPLVVTEDVAQRANGV